MDEQADRTKQAKVLAADPIWQGALDELAERYELVMRDPGVDVSPLVKDRHCVILRSGVKLTGDTLREAADLELIVRAGSGLDNIDLDAAADMGIRVARVPGASADAVAELALGLLLAAARHIGRADASVRAGSWPKHELGGVLVAPKTLGIVGAGRIGSRLAAMGAALGMRVLACVEHPDPDRAAAFAAQGVTLTHFDTVVAESDLVSVHTPLKESTRHLIDSAAIRKMKAGSILVNTARGGVVDEVSLHAALAAGHLRAAALDVHEREGDGVVPELAALPNVVLTPHIGGMALETQQWIGERVLAIVDAHFEGRLDRVLAVEERVL